MRISTVKGRATGRAVSRRPLTVQSRVSSQSVYVRFITHKLVFGQVALPVLRFSCQCHSSNAPYSSSSTRCSYQKDKRTKPGNLRKNTALIGNRVRWIEKYFHFLLHSPAKASRSDTTEPVFNGDRRVMYSAFDREIRSLPLQL
jgi:hypothetical protein